MKQNKVLNKIGVFDSGQGGLVILDSVRDTLPNYNYVYYGDIKNLPFGNKTQKQIYNFTVKGIEYLIAHGCILIIIACNSASAKALRKVQQEWLPKHAANIKVLGVIIPTLEALKETYFPAGIIATESTIKSKVYQKELQKLFPHHALTAKAAPELATLIEQRRIKEAKQYAAKLIETFPSDTKSILLGCTHYPIIKDYLQKQFPSIVFISQTDIIPKSVKKYLYQHPEIKNLLSKGETVSKYFTK